MSSSGLRKYIDDAKDKSVWTNQHEWFMEKLELFYRVFSPRVKALDLKDDEVPDGPTGDNE